LKLPAGFAIEADALYQRIGNDTGYYPGNNSNAIVLNRTRGNSWQFPILAKYYFNRRSTGWQPFVSTGYAFRSTWYHTDTSVLSGSPILVGGQSDYSSGVDVGAAFAAGVRFKYGRVSVAPEFRYTRWGSDSVNRLRRDEPVFLLGVHF
jgi:hypothetical protein